MKLLQKTVLLSMMVAGLSACSSSDVTWPNISDSEANKIGSWIETDRVREIQPGVTRDRVKELLGNPIFSDNSYFDNQWDYVFNFQNNVEGQPPMVCQYKVEFNNNVVSNVYWKYPECQQLVEASQEQPVEQVTPSVPQILFWFDSAKLTPQAKQEIATLADQIRTSNITSITLEGYSDRVGSRSYNIKLSKRRAEVVKKALITNGLNNVEITTVGKGVGDFVSCATERGKALKSCLKPNRRVEVLFNQNFMQPANAQNVQPEEVQVTEIQVTETQQ